MMDYNIIFLIVGVIVAAGGVVGTQFYYRSAKKEKQVETRQSLLADVEQTAREKSKQEQQLAKEVAVENKLLAAQVKQDMKDHIDRLLQILKGEIELSNVRSYSKMGEIDTKVVQLKQDLIQHIEREKEELTRMQRSIDFFQTMQFGPEAKSIPPYITGEERTPEHEQEAYKGVFASRADTTHEDTKDREGRTTAETKAEQDKDAETESEEGGEVTK